MKQSFDIRGGADMGRRNLPRLRTQMAADGIDFFYLPHEDEYQNEYLPDNAQRLAWATGFTGSAGCAVIGLEQAAVFVDGRYTLQAADQLDAALFETHGFPDPGPFAWLGGANLSGKTVAYDPQLVSPNDLAILESAVSRAGGTLRATSPNPVDTAWTDRPPAPMAPVLPQPLEYVGMSAADKRTRLAEGLRENNADAAIVTSPASLAWAFNIRGGDVMCTPLPLGRAILHADGTADLFLAEAKTSPALLEHLGNGVSLHPIEALETKLIGLAGKRVSLDPSVASAWFFNTLEDAGAEILRAPDPCALPKACKNEAELAGTRAAHIRDGAA
jgi:Xaa-Pro aminopeptidase